MKKALRILVPLLLAIFIIACIVWYLFDYDPQFTRDMLLNEARYFTDAGNERLSSLFYDLAYRYSDQDEDVAIELANQYKSEGNYTKAEYTLTNAIADGATVELYTALCKTFVEQDKLLDAVTMLSRITDPVIKAQIAELRPAAPTADYASGFYTEYISVTLKCETGALYYSLDSEYPSTATPVFSEPIVLPQGETQILAISVGENGLVSPLTTLNYTVGGVIEPVTFADPAVDASVREILSLDAESTIWSNALWEITEFTYPEEATVFSDLASFPYLTKLTINGHTIDSLSYLSTLTYLTEIDLSDSRFPADDLSYLATLPELTHLSIRNCSLSTVANLAAAPKLQSLDLGNNTVRNLDPLSSITTLSELLLDHNAVTNLGALATLPSLQVLDVSYNSITSISTLSPCTTLRELNVANNQLSTLSGLETLTNLTSLDVSSNSLTDVSIVAGCFQLQTLNISTNELTDISALKALDALQTVDFSYNQIAELPAWSENSALRTVTGSHNLLENIDVLKKAENLSYVYMDYNNIASIDALANCYHLVLVNVYANPIEDVSALTQHNIIVNYDPT